VMNVLAYLGRLNAPLDTVPVIRWRRRKDE